MIVSVGMYETKLSRYGMDVYAREFGEGVQVVAAYLHICSTLTFSDLGICAVGVACRRVHHGPFSDVAASRNHVGKARLQKQVDRLFPQWCDCLTGHKKWTIKSLKVPVHNVTMMADKIVQTLGVRRVQHLDSDVSSFAADEDVVRFMSMRFCDILHAPLNLQLDPSRV